MKFFSDVNGLIAWVKEGGESNHPELVNGSKTSKIENNKVLILELDGAISDEYQLWDSLSALAVAITGPINAPIDEPLHLDTAVAIGHERLEAFRTDYYKGHAENSEHYPLVMGEDNSGIFIEQMVERIIAPE